MDDWEYILIDYGRYKDLENIEMFKSCWKIYLLCLIFFIINGILSVILNIIQFLIICGVICLILLLCTLRVHYKKDEKMSLFGTFPRLKLFFKKNKIEEIIKKFGKIDEGKENTIDYSPHELPEWFECFLRNKGINENNIDLLISELKEKYDYPIITFIFGLSGWIVSFVGWEHISNFIKNFKLNKFLLLTIFSLFFIISTAFLLENMRKKRKRKLHPFLHKKRRKEELLHDLELMRMEWNILRKHREKKSKLIYRR